MSLGVVSLYDLESINTLFCCFGTQVKLAPRAVDERDDKLLSSLMSKLEAQNAEIDGDDEEEDADEGMGSVNIDGV